MAAVSLDNRQAWKDAEGNPIHAHGGGFLQVDDSYYWFGECRQDGKKVSCYRSKDLQQWELRGNVLTIDSEFKPIYYRTDSELDPYQVRNAGYGSGAVIERPKVLYNALTRKYVMWMHWENGKNYHDARCAVATCDSVDGDYIYHGSFNPIGQMSRDCTLFQDDDGTAYFVSAARDNADLILYRLSDDYLSIDEQVRTLWPGQYREAPAIMKRGSYYFMITSACTGWLPNQGMYAYSTSLTGKWSPLFKLGGPTTYDTQPTFILPIRGKEHTTYLYVGDRWDPTHYSQSSYVFLPLLFPTENSMTLEWSDMVKIDVEAGTTQGLQTESGAWRLYCNGPDRYLAANAELDPSHMAAFCEKLHYASERQKWRFIEVGQQTFRIKHQQSELFLQPYKQSTAAGAEVVLADDSAHPAQEWEMIALEDGWCKFRNLHSGMAMSISRGDGQALRQEVISQRYDVRRGFDPQLFLAARVF